MHDRKFLYDLAAEHLKHRKRRFKNLNDFLLMDFRLRLDTTQIGDRTTTINKVDGIRHFGIVENHFTKQIIKENPYYWTERIVKPPGPASCCGVTFVAAFG